MKRTISVVTMVLLLAAGVALAANGFDLSWHAISGGGGHATGGQFALDGGVVQPAGVMQGGNYQVQGGFFAGLAAPTAPSLPADVDGDCDVDIVDIMLVASRWNSRVGDAKYDPLYDRDHDGDIDIVDIMLVASHWGEVCAPRLAAPQLPERAKAEAPVGQALAGPALWIEPELSRVQPGDAFTVEVIAGEVPDLGGFEFTLTFDEAVLGVEGVELGPLLASTGRQTQALGPAVDNGPLRFGAFSLGEGPGAVGGGIVARIHLQAVAAGSSRLIFSAARLADTHGKAVSAVVEGEAAVVVGGAGEVPVLPPKGEPKGVPLPTREGP